MTFTEFCKKYGLNEKQMLSHGGMWAKVALEEAQRAPVAWRNPMNRSSWVDAVACAAVAPMTGKVVLDARVVLEVDEMLRLSTPSDSTSG